jgi:hypothetical protein
MIPISKYKPSTTWNSFSVTCVRRLSRDLKVKSLPPKFINYLHNDSFPFPEQFYELYLNWKIIKTQTQQLEHLLQSSEVQNDPKIIHVGHDNCLLTNQAQTGLSALTDWAVGDCCAYHERMTLNFSSLQSFLTSPDSHSAHLDNYTVLSTLIFPIRHLSD